MAERDDRSLRHFILKGFTGTEQFRAPLSPLRPKPVPEQDRTRHGAALLRQLEESKPDFAAARVAQENAGLEGGFGLQLEFESFPDIDLAFESLSRERLGIELLNVRHEDQRTYATVFVPDGKLAHFERLVQDYLQEKRDRNGHARDHKKLLNAIRQIRTASLRALWTDDLQVFPTSDEEVFWWEAWLPIRGDRLATIKNFRDLSQAQNLRVAPGELQFPERTVLLIYASASQMKQSMMTLNSIAELRRAKETADFFDSLVANEQQAWLDDLLGHTAFVDPREQVPYVCLLDTGINNGHQLIAQALADTDLHTVEPAWGTNDDAGHGTTLAGVALMGDLTKVLETSEPIEVRHRLESVKLLPQDGANSGDARHHGYLTVEAVARPEITAPNRSRVFGMAVTTQDNRDRGRPSAWSAAVDRLAADAEGEGATPRLIVISAGNIKDPHAWADYPSSNTTDGIHDPGQAWNALTVGAYTDLINITEPDADGYQPIAMAGGLSTQRTKYVAGLQ